MVWYKKKGDVEDEIRELHRMAGGVGEPTTQEEFRLRNTAAKNIELRLDNAEKTEMLREAQAIMQEGNPPDIQQK